MYFAYDDDVSTLVVGNAEIEEFYKEIWLYETVPGD